MRVPPPPRAAVGLSVVGQRTQSDLLYPYSLPCSWICLFKTVSLILIVRTHSNEMFHTFYGIGTMLEGKSSSHMGYYYISPDMYSTYSCPVLDVLLFGY